jgi:hypothetical protein
VEYNVRHNLGVPGIVNWRGNNALVAGNGSRALDASPSIYTSHLADTPKADDLHELHNILDFVGAECCRVSLKGNAVI